MMGMTAHKMMDVGRWCWVLVGAERMLKCLIKHVDC